MSTSIIHRQEYCILFIAAGFTMRDGKVHLKKNTDEELRRKNKEKGVVNSSDTFVNNEEDKRNIDDLADFIEGERTKFTETASTLKKREKKRRQKERKARYRVEL